MWLFYALVSCQMLNNSVFICCAGTFLWDISVIIKWWDYLLKFITICIISYNSNSICLIFCRNVKKKCTWPLATNFLVFLVVFLSVLIFLFFRLKTWMLTQVYMGIGPLKMLNLSCISSCRWTRSIPIISTQRLGQIILSKWIDKHLSFHAYIGFYIGSQVCYWRRCPYTCMMYYSMYVI